MADNTNEMDNKQHDAGHRASAEALDARVGLKTQGIHEDVVINSTCCWLCNATLKKEHLCPEKSAMFKSTTEKYRATLAAAEASMEAELVAATSNLNLCKVGCKSNEEELAKCQTELDNAIINVIEKQLRECQLSAFMCGEESPVFCLSKANTAIMAVKNAQKVFKDKLVAAEARYHFAKERCDTNKLLKEINSEIGSSLDSGGVNAEQG